MWFDVVCKKEFIKFVKFVKFVKWRQASEFLNLANAELALLGSVFGSAELALLGSVFGSAELAYARFCISTRLRVFLHKMGIEMQNNFVYSHF